MTTAYEIRKRARNSLGNQIFDKRWLYPLVVTLIANAILGFSGFTVAAVFIIYGLIYVGHSKYYLETSRRRNAPENMSLALDGFKGGIGENIITGLLYLVFLALWSMLFIIPGIIKYYSYSMTFFIKAEHPEYTATQAITESRRIMNGNKFRLFCLDLSFIGWIIVGALCLGIGTLWVSAYMNMAHAEFYREISGDRVGAADPDSFLDSFIESL